ncbi:methyl-accepting chemotaxis protein [Vibrio salinus]|uniref:methyl-accepting chemotaxis protein n=1 Tax=Vibrio salinus TaxID=2899784 RepID=UPI001E5E6A05|nr:methyl-accepting chemotaxis protein [Vibrio salinus]MCE0492598.1 methyl-accepting chemotaxis protein [Vibrio salinus]
MRLTLKQKLTGASLTAVIIMAGALTWLSIERIYEQTQKSMFNRVETLTSTASKGISDWVTIRKSITSSFEQNSDENNPVPFLKQGRIAGGFDELYYGTVTGKMFRSHPARNRAGYDPRERPWYRDAVSAGKMILTTAYKDAVTNELLITIAEPVLNHGQLNGVVGADVLIKQLVDGVLSFDAGENARTMLIDTQDGKWLAHPDKSLILKPVSAVSSKLSMDSISKAAKDKMLVPVELNGHQKLYYFHLIPGTPWIFAVELDRKTELASAHSLLWKLILMATVITAIVLVAVSWLVSFLVKDLRRVTKALEEIASGEADLTQRLEIHTDDEVGRLAYSFNQFVNNMHQMVMNLGNVSAQLSKQSSHTAQQSEKNSHRIHHQQDEVNMVATAINEMAAATHEIAGNAEHTATNSNDAVAACSDGAGQVRQTQYSIENLAKEVEVATGVIEELEGHGHTISTILSTIQGIADQTNLLALNAAIEAARAGEQGRGFAVVADEVRVLSQRTHASTQEIQEMIETLQSTTGKAVSIMTNSGSLAVKSVDDANKASESLEHIRSVVSSISDMATQIASAAEEQASVTSEITRNSQSIRDVSNELASEALDASEQAAQLFSLSNELESEVKRFKV